MTMQTNLSGRLRNTPLLLTKGLLPLFEAAINSIHAIEEAGILNKNGKITIEILRIPQGELRLKDTEGKNGSDTHEEIVGFKITDNGIGFTDDNMESFNTLDSEYKIEKGGRGIGRLLWLKAFKRVKIESTFTDNSEGKQKFRSFIFDANSGVTNENVKVTDGKEQNTTTVHLDNFNAKYRSHSRKMPKAIANSIVEHCLWYFIREGGVPVITIVDENEKICLDNVFEEHMHTAAITESILVKSKEFELIHVKLRTESISNHTVAWCADNRLVDKWNIDRKIPGLHGRLSDDDGEFVYSCYVSSSILDEKVRPERTGFEIIEAVDDLFDDTEIGISDIQNAVIDRVKIHLAEYLEKNKKRARERIEDFVSKKAPRYRPILHRIPEEELNIDPDMSEKDLELALHKHLAEIEGQLLAEGHDIMSPKEGEDYDDYSKRLREYLDKAEDIKKSDLANYVSHRRVILDLLTTAIQRGVDGKYTREDMIHNLIMTIRKESNEIMFESCNLWLVDERLAFHDYLASDKSLSSMPITGNKESKEPDICALNVFDKPVLVSEGNKLPLASIVVIEIKRPMRNDAAVGEEHDAIEQALGYLERIRAGKVMTANGRSIPQSEDIPGFCYILADITPSVEKRCKLHSLKRTSDGLGYFGYNDNFKAYIEVISFDRLVNSAKERNRAFFDKLGLPAN